MSKITIGVIGLNFGSSVHVPAFRFDSRYHVKGIAARDHDKAKEQARRLDLECAYPTWQAMLEDDAIEAVSIAVPPVAQPDIIQAACLHRKHIFCEKPLAASLSQAILAVESAQRAKIVHGMNFIFPELPLWQKMREILVSGVLGSIRHFSYIWQVETYASRIQADVWKNHPDEGGGVLNNFGSHALYNLEWFFGTIQNVRGMFLNSAAGEVCMNCQILFESGLSGSMSISTDTFLGRGHVLEVFGNNGTAVLHNANRDYAWGFKLFMGTRPMKSLEMVEADPIQNGKDGRILPTSKLASRFLDAILTNQKMHPNLQEGLRVQILLEKVREELA
jgi:predicted dehydrogenase